MSALASISLSMHRLRFAKKRACAWLLVVSWLLLNTQLALASHNCNLQFSGEAPMAQHMMHMQNSVPSQQQMQTQEPLCEKHCVQESAQQDHSNLTLAALPTSSELAFPVSFSPLQYLANAPDNRSAGRDRFLPVP